MSLRQMLTTMSGVRAGLDYIGNLVLNRRDGSQIVLDADATTGAPTIYTRTAAGIETAYPVGAGNATLPTLTSLTGLGDSITFGTAATVQARQFLDIVSAALGAGTPSNQGISGTVLQNSPDSTGSPRANNGRDRFAAAMLGSNKKDGCVVAYGFNDARYTGAPTTFNVTQYQNDLSEVIAGLIAGGYDKAKVFVLDPFWMSDTGLATGSAGFTGQTRAGFEAFTTAALAVATAFGTWFVPAYATMRDNGGAALIDVDNIHPTDAGHSVIAGAVLSGSYQPNTKRQAGVSVSSSAAQVLNYIVRPAPSSYSIPISYTVEYALEGTYAYTGTTTITPSSGAWSGSWSGLSGGDYRVRARANFADGTSTPWAFSSTQSVQPASAVFLRQVFNGTPDTAITSLTPTKGGTWAVQTGNSPATPNKVAADGGSLYSTTGTGVYTNSATPASADYYVEGALQLKSIISADNVGVTGRADLAANTYYFARYSQTAGGWQLFKNVAGTATQLGSTYTDAWTSGTRTVRLTMIGTTISMSVDGTVRASVTDSAIAAAGVAGVRFGLTQTNNTGIHMVSITASA